MTPDLASDPIDISVVLPAFNEEENIDAMLSELHTALRPLGRPYEIIFVDDRSTDGTQQHLARIRSQHPELRVVTHSVNSGESAAILSGYDVARGQFVFTMDSDLQNDPADCPRMLALLEEKGVDAVFGVRASRQDSASKRLSSKVANAVRGTILSDGISDAGCTMRVVRRKALCQLLHFRAMHRFMGTILRFHGYSLLETPINHRPRVAGVSKYGIGNRLWVGLYDLVGMRWYRKRMIPVNRVERVD